MTFRGKVALVTGAASGMGRLATQRLAAAGATVAAVDRDANGLEETARGLANVRTYTLDVTELGEVRSLVARIEAELGSLDRVMHAAGIMPGAPLLEEDPLRTARVMRVNYEGTVHVVSATLPGMIERGRGDLICFGSVAGEALTPRLGAYCASKAAVNAYMEILARENAGKGVRILLACPPMVNTPLLQQSLASDGPKSLRQAIDQNMLAKPEDVLDALEASLERGDSVSHPLAMSKWLHAMRRFAPSLLWKIIERSETAMA